MLRLCVVGGLGRMGQAVASLALRETDVEIGWIWEREDRISQTPDYGLTTGYHKNRVVMVSDGREAVGEGDVVVDFSSRDAFDEVVSVCGDLQKPLVTGTTAVEDKDERLRALAAKVAVVSSPNMAVGVNLVFGLAHVLGESLEEESDIEIIESHHRTKRDVPSGTALEIAGIIGTHTGRGVIVGRKSGSQKRADEIFIHSLRIGDVSGKHTIALSLKGETIEITHTAQSRDCFAAGALRAARFAAKADRGLYTMFDVLNLRSLEGG
jgi:4-hydroxy-tetrahydrodipicolinate reductase